MKEKLLQQMYGILNALNSVSVSGKQNVNNLLTGIVSIEDMIRVVAACNVSAIQQENQDVDSCN